MIDTLENWISNRLPAGSACAVARIDDRTNTLLQPEIAAIAKAIPNRKAEFSTGRHLARQSLVRLGEAAHAIPVGQRRQPVWPDHITGSISHIGAFCAVAVAPKSVCRALGLDLAICADVGPQISQRTSTPEELARNAAQVPEDALHAALFSIRETIFKAYYPQTASELDFADVSINLNGRTECFTADLINPDRPDLLGQRQISGSFTFVNGHAISLIALP